MSADREKHDALLREAQANGAGFDPAFLQWCASIMDRLEHLESPHEAPTAKRKRLVTPKPMVPAMTPAQIERLKKETRILEKEDLPPVLDPIEPKR